MPVLKQRSHICFPVTLIHGGWEISKFFSYQKKVVDNGALYFLGVSFLTLVLCLRKR